MGAPLVVLHFRQLAGFGPHSAGPEVLHDFCSRRCMLPLPLLPLSPSSLSPAAASMGPAATTALVMLSFVRRAKRFSARYFSNANSGDCSPSTNGSCAKQQHTYHPYFYTFPNNFLSLSWQTISLRMRKSREQWAPFPHLCHVPPRAFRARTAP